MKKFINISSRMITITTEMPMMIMITTDEKGNLQEEEGGKHEQVLEQPCIAKPREVSPRCCCWTKVHLVVRMLESGL